MDTSSVLCASACARIKLQQFDTAAVGDLVSVYHDTYVACERGLCSKSSKQRSFSGSPNLKGTAVKRKSMDSVKVPRMVDQVECGT